MTETIQPAVRVLLLEDDEDQRYALAVTLRRLDLDVDAVGTVAEFHQRLRSQTYAVAIVDLGLPDGDGRSVVRFLDKLTSMGIIILSVHGDVEERIHGFGIGADLYFVKPVDCRELASAAIRLASRRVIGASPPVQRRLQATWSLIPSRSELISPGGVGAPLTPKELLFIDALAPPPGGVVSRSDLLLRLGYPDDAGGHRRLEALIRRLRLKLEEVSEDGPPISTAYGIGYAFSRPLITVSFPYGRTPRAG